MFTSNKTPYVFVTVPFKKTNLPGKNSQIDVGAPSNEAKDIKNQRCACVELHEKCLKMFAKPAELNNLLASEQDREKYITKFLNTTEEYSAALITLVTKVPTFGVSNYYMWSSSLCEKQEVAYDDYRYELLGLYYNISALLLNMAQYLICVRSTVGTASGYEKEAYRLLLRASGYFDLCRTLASKIKENPIGVATVPFPLDSAIGILTVLSLTSLAQAQEIGVNRAIEADPKQTNETATKLSNKLYELYETTKQATGKVSSKNDQFVVLSTLVTVKCDVYKALVYNNAATWAFNSNPSNGLWFLSMAKKYATLLSEYITLLAKKKIKLPSGSEGCIKMSLALINRNEERINKVNSLVHHAKPTEGGVPVPLAQVLAVKPNTSLPVDLPSSS
ncbi:hypothetical protein STCU_01122 [Strigomonas culicis]|uniref:BRO1 domain-containing protein n=1 Tax=Strigomonas culicis TaxID=28005 RepID=S9VPI5_9TRYP|nr:hypothetical protein STCU_04787 [Strigomonas culicis]EPY30845.1 hypothetical protein STCU_03858 [Strigomonas culicis]EPY35552.1 hypothetical protein STCU_01122 [Strigomonas culicis]|eukprot:EPY28976.1 hypothetical protein STCU_04787 [Strigomonas culicis]